MPDIFTKFSSYKYGLIASLKDLDQQLDKIQAFADAIESTTKAGGTIYVAGNGGSAAIADHLVCDVCKGVGHNSDLTPRVVSLVSNVPMLTAIGNDIGYDQTFSYYFDKLTNNAEDLLIAISSSGNSPNILRLLEKAEDIGVRSVALVGFNGGAALKLADIAIHIEAYNYGIVEDMHQAIMHLVSQYLAEKHACH